MRFKANYVEHLKVVRGWATQRRARAQVDVLNGMLAVQHGNREVRWRPQYVGRCFDDRLAYFEAPDRHVRGFVGWLPYRIQAWAISLDKLAFKVLAERIGVPVPRYWTSRAAIDAPFVIKARQGAFGYGMRGPFAANVPGSDFTTKEYADEFKWGKVARAWYWAGKLVVLEAFDMPTVTGDGVSCYRDLLKQRSSEVPDDFDVIARLQGVAPDDVLPPGKHVVCDFRYVSPFNPTIYANHNLLPKLAGSALAARFQAAGERIWPHIPGAAERPMGFVLDAIVDAAEQPWFLEINSNPQLHPDIYPAALDSVFGLEAS